MTMITIDHLTKRYGPQVAVADVSFSCPPGTVTGFLGPNGAGKSTTLRALVGLTTPTSGTATVAGRDYRDLPNPGRQVGVLLDAGAQHAGRTGREVLSLAATVLGVGPERVDEVLGRVGLAGRPAGKRVGNYSLGMRQRLGLAGALLGDPQVLVLDEPANGLDPEGIFWMRGLLRGFADRGGTVLLSSHLLHEVEAVADRLVVIAGGRIVAQGSKQELLAGRGTVVRGPDRAVLERALRAAGIRVVPGEGDGLVADAEPLAVGQAVAAAGAVLTELRAAGGEGLEDLFRSLTGNVHQVQEVAA
jgi:ABC-2 type transport system ATP-binding protein